MNDIGFGPVDSPVIQTRLAATIAAACTITEVVMIATVVALFLFR